MKKITYDVFTAIYIRSTSETMLTDSYGNRVDIDFKTSVQLASDKYFMFGFGYTMLMGAGIQRTMTREQYYKTMSSYRKYYYDLSNIDPAEEWAENEVRKNK